ncbi:hypothetical protein POM88_028574 [Heracleum sosnowskyi]|uniref:Uncharacterized protein n=1 Tax=Heracleum sosnowskyi TaxID=360622 RepID=A0AAD8HSH4_9APIA|nr:hypothetical protein POM88_028574 [Heracleum sosnowskyi]
MSSEAVKEVPEKKEDVTEKKKEVRGGEVVASSYWGVARPRVTKEDGTEWPWNVLWYVISTNQLDISTRGNWGLPYYLEFDLTVSFFKARSKDLKVLMSSQLPHNLVLNSEP